MSKTQKVIIGLLSVTACIVVGSLIVVILFSFYPGRTLTRLQDTPTAIPIIVDAPSIIGSTPDEVERRYKAFSDFAEIKPGDDEDFPDGGKFQVFSVIVPREEMSISFRNDGKAASVDYYGMEGRHLVLDDWKEILKLFNLDVNQMPDKILQSGITGKPWKYIWSDYRGYRITLNDAIGTEYVLLFELFKQ